MRSEKYLRRIGAGLVLVTVMLALGGCQSAEVAEPLTETTSGNDPDSMLNFWHTLAERNVTSHDEALHAILLFKIGCDKSENYADRVAAMKGCGWLPPGWDKPANEAITRGTTSMILARMLNIKGGLSMWILGPTPRYATRELQSMNIMPAGTENQSISGSQFLTIIGQVEDYLVLQGGETEAAAAD